MTIFTFYDLPIAKAVFHYNDTYGEIFKIIGLLPTCIAGIFYAISNLATRRLARRPVISAILSIMSLLLFVGFTLLSIYHLKRSFFVPTIVFCIRGRIDPAHGFGAGGFVDGPVTAGEWQHGEQQQSCRQGERRKMGAVAYHGLQFYSFFICTSHCGNGMVMPPSFRTLYTSSLHLST